MLLRERAAAALLAITALAASGCVNGQSRDIPPGPTAVPPNASVYVYVAQAREPGLSTDGGAVVVYQLGEDGFLPSAPKASVQAVNPRRLLRHPEKPILYVATASQVLAFDMTGGSLKLLEPCEPNGGAAPPCATAPVPGSNPVDMKIAKVDVDGAARFVLYVVERGGGNNLDTLTRVAAYQLDEIGGLPSQPSSQVQTVNSLSYQGAEIVLMPQEGTDSPGFAYISDAGQSDISRFPLLANGDLPNPVPTGTPLTPTPTPQPDPTPTPDPSPSPTAWRASNPGRMIRAAVATPAPPDVAPTPTGLPLGEVLYVVEQGRRRIGAIPVDQEGNLPKNPTSESNTRGVYNSIIVDSSLNPIRIYGAAFQNGQVDSFEIDADGNIIDGTLSATFANTASYPTGVALLPPMNGSSQSTLFVSLGGFNRVDAYSVNPDGTLPELPFSSTEAVNDTFPSDILVYTE